MNALNVGFQDLRARVARVRKANPTSTQPRTVPSSRPTLEHLWISGSSNAFDFAVAELRMPRTFLGRSMNRKLGHSAKEQLLGKTRCATILLATLTGKGSRAEKNPNSAGLPEHLPVRILRDRELVVALTLFRLQSCGIRREGK